MAHVAFYDHPCFYVEKLIFFYSSIAKLIGQLKHFAVLDSTSNCNNYFIFRSKINFKNNVKMVQLD